VPPSPYRLLWLELAERQYLDVPDDTRALVDERLTLLESDPSGPTGATYDAASDQWSAPIAERGLILYARQPSRGRLAEGSSTGTSRADCLR
jgi:hypothetical protein